MYLRGENKIDSGSKIQGKIRVVSRARPSIHVTIDDILTRPWRKTAGLGTQDGHEREALRFRPQSAPPSGRAPPITYKCRLQNVQRERPSTVSWGVGERRTDKGREGIALGGVHYSAGGGGRKAGKHERPKRSIGVPKIGFAKVFSHSRWRRKGGGNEREEEAARRKCSYLHSRLAEVRAVKYCCRCRASSGVRGSGIDAGKRRQ